MSRPRKKHEKSRKTDRAARSESAAPPRSVKWPVFKAVIIFVGVMGGYYAIDHYTLLLMGDGIQTYLAMIARSSAAILRVLGHEATTSGTAIVSPEFSVQIVRGCDALDPTFAFVAAVLASPVSIWLKLPGLVVGTISLLLVNLVRIVSLFFVGIYFREIFDIMHYELWQAGFIGLAIVFWAIWVQWATRRRERMTHAAA